MKANSFVIGMPFIPLLLPFPASSLIRTTAEPGLVHLRMIWLANMVGFAEMPSRSMSSAEMEISVIFRSRFPPPRYGCRFSVYWLPTGIGMQVMPRTFISTW